MKKASEMTSAEVDAAIKAQLAESSRKEQERWDNARCMICGCARDPNKASVLMRMTNDGTNFVCEEHAYLDTSTKDYDIGWHFANDYDHQLSTREAQREFYDTIRLDKHKRWRPINVPQWLLDETEPPTQMTLF